MYFITKLFKVRLQKPIFPTRPLSRYLYQNAIFTSFVIYFPLFFIRIVQRASRRYVTACAAQKFSLKVQNLSGICSHCKSSSFLITIFPNWFSSHLVFFSLTKPIVFWFLLFFSKTSFPAS